MTIHDLHYDITIEQHDFSPLYERLKSYQKIFVVTDHHVYDLHQDVFQALKDRFDTYIHVIQPGETSKSLQVYETICHAFLSHSIKRDDVILAIGGGVVGDLTGFVAATLLRGIAFIQVPTTLLSMVDSSVGSKVGINTIHGKNLIGQFYDPTFVFIQLDFLSTLSKRELHNGYAEIIKAGLIGDPSLFHTLKDIHHNIKEVISKALQVKINIVKKDPFEQHERMFLNFGHTLGHAIEKEMGYQSIKHGEAISHGMVYAIEKGIECHITPKALKQELIEVFNLYGLLDMNIQKVESYEIAMQLDKKQRKDGLKFVLLQDIGQPIIHTL